MEAGVKILIMGLPGSGKTTLARILATKLGAVHWNADEVRANINRDLGFTIEDRIEHARRMGWLCDQVTSAGYVTIADFVCPTVATRRAFNPDYLIFMDTIRESRFADTNALFERPIFGEFDFKINSFDAETHAEIACADIRSRM